MVFLLEIAINLATAIVENFWAISGHVAYGLNTLAFILRDILWLRFFAMIAAASDIIFNTIGDSIQLIPVFWDSIFVMVNAVHIFFLIKAMLGVRFNEEERTIYKHVFSSLKPVNFHRLLQAGKFKRYKKGYHLTHEKKPVNTLFLIYSGEAHVFKGKEDKHTLLPYSFVGELAFTTGKPASATVKLTQEAYIFTWDFSALKDLLGDNRAMKVAFQRSLGVDMAQKLGAQK